MTAPAGFWRQGGDMVERLGDWWVEASTALSNWAWPFAIAGLARLMWYAQQIRAGRARLAFSLIAFEIGMAILCAIIGVGIADYFHIAPGPQQAAFIGLFSWFGMNGIQSLIVLWLRRNGVPMPPVTQTHAPPVLPADPSKH
ncbi:phage holin family protein [Ferrovibrio xuzhouensis]|uniref:Phage holin family protein n=1 Tax=Ferrovibrio xuzhouensis TaxID=1576914 RepID=A0ABV7VB10_9PROT